MDVLCNTILWKQHGLLKYDKQAFIISPRSFINSSILGTLTTESKWDSIQSELHAAAGPQRRK